MTWHTLNATMLYIKNPILNPTKPTHIPLVTFRIFWRQKPFQAEKDEDKRINALHRMPP